MAAHVLASLHHCQLPPLPVSIHLLPSPPSITPSSCPSFIIKEPVPFTSFNIITGSPSPPHHRPPSSSTSSRRRFPSSSICFAHDLNLHHHPRCPSHRLYTATTPPPDYHHQPPFNSTAAPTPSATINKTKKAGEEEGNGSSSIIINIVDSLKLSHLADIPCFRWPSAAQDQAEAAARSKPCCHSDDLRRDPTTMRLRLDHRHPRQGDGAALPSIQICTVAVKMVAAVAMKLRRPLAAGLCLERRPSPDLLRQVATIIGNPIGAALFAIISAASSLEPSTVEICGAARSPHRR